MWSDFNKILFTIVRNEYEESFGHPFDLTSLCELRNALTSFAWGRFDWNFNFRVGPKDEKEAQHIVLPEDNPVPTGHAPPRDRIYQAWRAKYNNQKKAHLPEVKQMKKLSRKKAATARRSASVTTRHTSDNEPVNVYGTLVGKKGYEDMPQLNKEDYKNLLAEMKTSTDVKPHLVKQLVRNWEVVYSIYHEITGQDLLLKHMADELPINKFGYYEAYAAKIAILGKNALANFTQQMWSLAQCLPLMLAGEKVQLLTADTYDRYPFISTIMQIVIYFGESRQFFLQMPTNVEGNTNIHLAIADQKTCINIIDYHPAEQDQDKRFGIAALGVPFLNDLTEIEAAFAFASAPDVFGFAPDKVDAVKSKRIYLTSELLRRVCLHVQDHTKNERFNLGPVFYLTTLWMQAKGKRGQPSEEEAERGLAELAKRNN